MLPGDSRCVLDVAVQIPQSYPAPLAAGRCGRIRDWFYIGGKLYCEVHLGRYRPEVMLDPDDLNWLAPDAAAAMEHILNNREQSDAAAWDALEANTTRCECEVADTLRAIGLPTQSFLDRIWASPDFAFVLAGDKAKTDALDDSARERLKAAYDALRTASQELAAEEQRIIS